MTVTKPHEEGSPDGSSSWKVAVVALFDRSLDERHRFRRLLLLLIFLPLLAVALLLAVNGMHGVLGLFRM